MKREIKILLSFLLLTLLAGCANINSKQQVLAAGSQVEVRSYQTRTYDTDNKILVMRAVMATLQDLRFVIDKADDTVGVVSATKLDGYALSISVSVRPNGDQMVVRANAQINLKAIEEPGPYQDFFAALDKGLFLDNNLVETQVAAQSQPVPQVARADAGEVKPATSVYAFYGEAEAEIDAGSQDSDLWARALVEVEGDEQKRKARYIELRAEEMYRQSPAAVTQKRSVIPAAVAPVNPVVSQPAAEGSKARLGEAMAGIVPTYFVTGTYFATISGKKLDDFSRKYKRFKVSLAQSGNEITGSFADGGEIEGTLEGDTITYKWYLRYMEGSGEWKILEDGTGMAGKWQYSRSDRGGAWDMQKTDVSPIKLVSPVDSASIQAGQEADSLTGVYLDNNGTQVNIQQSGNRISGTYGNLGGTIEGTLSGDVIEYKWEQRTEKTNVWLSGNGRFQVKEGGSVLTGNWWDIHSSTRRGTWTLTKIRDTRTDSGQAVSQLATRAEVSIRADLEPGLSGT